MTEINEGESNLATYMVRVYLGSVKLDVEFVSVEVDKTTSTAAVLNQVVNKLKLRKCDRFELAEILCSGEQFCKERRLEPNEKPVGIQLLWPKAGVNTDGPRLDFEYRFYLRKTEINGNRTSSSSWVEYTQPQPVDSFLSSFLHHHYNKEYEDLCNLPDLNEQTLLDNLKSRFDSKNIYTYVGSILIAVNPFQFFPIYNPKYVKMYQNKRLGDLPPHIFAIADTAFYKMLHTKSDQCIVISGESGSGKTESTNLLIHHLTALSQKGLHASGVEQTILGAGPVLEAFGNAKTVHNNNSSRFGKFIQVNYKENGMVHGAIVEKYLLEKSRIVSQASNERNYHVFYYLLAGADDQEKETLFLSSPEDYFYLKQSGCVSLEGIDEKYEFARLKQSMEMVGFSPEVQRRLFSVLSAVLHLGNVQFKVKPNYHHGEAVNIVNKEELTIISGLLKVKEETLIESLTKKKTVAGGETVVINYRLDDAIATRDAMAKCLYGALFDWIVLQVNHALITKRETTNEHKGNSIGVLDIFGFEDFDKNSFEQFCINYANEHLQYYFNQHIFKFEQEEYQKEGIQWKNIEFIDNTMCLDLFAKKPHGLFHLIDEECNFPGATSESLLQKMKQSQQSNTYYEVPQLRESAFIVVHYAGKVKYQIKDFREKNSDLMRPDVVAVLKNSNLAFVRELVGTDPVAVLRWRIVKAFFHSFFAFIDAGKRYRKGGVKVGTLRRRQSGARLASIRKSLGENSLSDATPTSSIDQCSPPASPTPLQPMTQVHENRRGKKLVIEDVVPENKKAPRSLEDVAAVQKRNRTARFIAMYDPKLQHSAKKIRSKSFKPKTRNKGLRDLKSWRSAAGQNILGVPGRHKKQAPSVGSQFQQSLSDLLIALNQSNPFFVRCIKSNTDKAPCCFDDNIIMRQLRYTGMLATVLIRQSGYNYRLTFEEFIHQYKILLPKGLVSSQDDVREFLLQLELSEDNYQIGKSKVFLRETEKTLLDNALHQALMKRIVMIQRWVRAKLERRKFLAVKDASIKIQACMRGFLAKKQAKLIRDEVAKVTVIQRWYRRTRARRRLERQTQASIIIQTCVRGWLARLRYQALVNQRRLELEYKERLECEQLISTNETMDLQSTTSDEGILANKDSSSEELLDSDLRHVRDIIDGRESEGSSGFPEDTPDHMTLCTQYITPPLSPTLHLPNPPEQTPQDDADSISSKVITPKDEKSLREALEKAHQVPRRRGVAKSQSAESISVHSTESKRSSAPLAKQESMSDTPEHEEMPKPGVGRRIVISPDILKLDLPDKTDQQKQPPDHSPEILTVPPAGGFRSSPYHNLKNKFRNIIGAKTSDSSSSRGSKSTKSGNKNSVWPAGRLGGSLKHKTRREAAADDSETSDTEEVAARRPSDLGVATLPLAARPWLPLSPKSPQMPGKVKEAWTMESTYPETKPKKKVRRGSKQPSPMVMKRKTEEKDKVTKWNITGTSQWQYPAEFMLSDVQELYDMSTFIFNKKHEFERGCGREHTTFERIFRSSLDEFHKTLITTTSLVMQDGSLSVKYRDLMTNYEQILQSALLQENAQDRDVFPITLGINAFRGYLDEFLKDRKKKEHDGESLKIKKKKKDKNKEHVFEYMSHRFVTLQVSIPTFCEMCNKMMWTMEKAQSCLTCKFTSHKKCTMLNIPECKSAAKGEHETGKDYFGANLERMILEGAKVPVLVDRLISAIEFKGLYTEGIYRKAGANARIRSLVKAINTNINNVEFDEYPIHVLTATLKKFYRELKEPLLTYDLYDDFIRAAELGENKDRIQALYVLFDRLPTANHDVLERLVFHLARVAQNQERNKMSPSNLAVIFGPCLLKTNRNQTAQESLSNVDKQTAVIEYVIQEHLRKINSTLADIDSLESATASATDRLSAVRASMRLSKPKPAILRSASLPEVPRKTSTSAEPRLSVTIKEDEEMDLKVAQEEERVLSEHIKSLQQEKESLTYQMPVLEYRHASSDEDMLESGDDLDSSGDSLDDLDDPLPDDPLSDLTTSRQSKIAMLNKGIPDSPVKKSPVEGDSNTRRTSSSKRRLDSSSSASGTVGGDGSGSVMVGAVGGDSNTDKEGITDVFSTSDFPHADQDDEIIV